MPITIPIDWNTLTPEAKEFLKAIFKRATEAEKEFNVCVIAPCPHGSGNPANCTVCVDSYMNAQDNDSLFPAKPL